MKPWILPMADLCLNNGILMEASQFFGPLKLGEPHDAMARKPWDPWGSRVTCLKPSYIPMASLCILTVCITYIYTIY